MNVKILVIPLSAALVGGCAWLNEPYHYVDERYVEPFYTTPTVIAVPGGRPVIARRPIYTRYGGRSDRDWYDRDRRRHGDTPENCALRTLQREAHEEREFIKDVGKVQMEMQRDAAQAQMKPPQPAAKPPQPAAKPPQPAVKTPQSAAKVVPKAAPKMMKK